MHQLHKIARQRPIEIVPLTEKNLPAYIMEDFSNVFEKGFDEKTNYCDTFDHLNQLAYAVKYERYVNADIPPGMYNFVEVDGDVYLSTAIADTTDYIDLNNNPAAKLSIDVATFFENSEIYKDLKISKKRGSLLYGPPGNGKSREILRASQVFLQKCPNGIGLSINTMNEVWFLAHLRKEKKETPLFVVFEELTNFTDGREELHTKLLNMLDGSEGIDNIYMVATTNYPKRLSQNITNRPGRFHNIIDVPNPTEALRREFLSKFVTEEHVNRIMPNTTDDFSIAHLKEVIVYAQLYKVSYHEAVKKVMAHMNLVKKGFAKIVEPEGQYV
jgi:hypothetical protein